MALHALQAAHAGMAPSVEPAAPTRFLEVMGMVTPEVLADDVEYGEVIQVSTLQQFTWQRNTSWEWRTPSRIV